MFEPQLPWWEFILRAMLVYLALLVMVRVTGKRTVGQFTPFDLLVVMLLSEAVSNALSGGDDSVTGGLLLAATLVALNVLAAMLTARSRRIDRLLDGAPVLLGRDGTIYEDALRRERVPASDFQRALRAADCELQDMRYAVLEADGTISIQRRERG